MLVNVHKEIMKNTTTIWLKKLSKHFADTGVSPNMISFMSLVFAAGSALAAAHAVNGGGRISILIAAVFILLRLACNVMDGMVALESDKKSKTGELWNDVPERFADVAIILGAGYLAQAHSHAMDLAWANGVLAVMTAYLRVMGASLKSPQYNLGPMGKTHRMALMIIAFIAEAIYPTGIICYAALWIMLFGQVITCTRRLFRVADDLKA